MFIGGDGPYSKINPYPSCKSQCCVDYKTGIPARTSAEAEKENENGFDECVNTCEQKTDKWYNMEKNKLEISLNGCRNKCNLIINTNREDSIDLADECKSVCLGKYREQLLELNKEYQREYNFCANFIKRFFA